MQPNQTLDFRSFLTTYFPEYVIDAINSELISSFGLWAIRSEKFNSQEEGRHLDKGICLNGPVGCGKTELMFMLRRYLSYLKSPYGFTTKIVWKFAEQFTQTGYQCLQQERNDVYYDELCMTDEKVKEPLKEYVSHFGNKILIGKELIMARYNLFKSDAIQSHFTTNEKHEALKAHYGERAYSRLTEMCNMFTMVGADRREKIIPTFRNNMHQRQQPKPREITLDEQIENKKYLNETFSEFLSSGKLSEYAAIDFFMLNSYGVPVASDDELRALMDTVRDARKSQVMSNASEVGNPRRVEKLRRLYQGGESDPEEQNYIWEQTRKHAVMVYFQKLKDEGKTKIFDLSTN
jgi:hypothetical protein